MRRAAIRASPRSWRVSVRRMYVSLSRLRIEPDRAPELVAAFRRRAGLVDAFEGFVDMQVWQSDRDPGTFDASRDYHNLFAARPDNVVLVKVAYWVGR